MKEYYMFHKPRGCITARRDARHATVMDYFPEDKRDELFPVGRLDKDTEGFLLVTNDGALAYNLMMPEREVPGIMARTWKQPIKNAVFKDKSCIEVTVGCLSLLRFSIHKNTAP